MFIQLIQGRVKDPGALRAALERWRRDLAPGAVGWLGSTSGVTADGTGIALARFESEEAARRNSARPEQAAWWAETSKLFSGEVTFHDFTEVTPFLRGGSDDAHFVQVMEGRVSDPDLLRESQAAADDERLSEYRPEIIGGVLALDEEGDYADAVYFTSEEAARAGERKEIPEDLRPVLEREMAALGAPRYLDLPEPWLMSPA